MAATPTRARHRDGRACASRTRRCCAGARRSVRRGRRRTAPNPWVGCVLVARRRESSARARPSLPAGPHAEVGALRRGRRPRPGRDRVRHARAVRAPRAHAAVHRRADRRRASRASSSPLEDPDPNGRGPRLRAAPRARASTVDVASASAPTRPRAIARAVPASPAHRSRVRASPRSRASLDGRVAAADGSSRWITGAAARADAHELRADSQAIVVGAGTALADQPALTVRDVASAAASARRCACCSTRRGRVPADGPAVRRRARADARRHDRARAAPARVDAWRAAGAKVEVVAPRRPASGVDLDETLALLGREGVLQVLVEGGGDAARRARSPAGTRTASSSTSRRPLLGSRRRCPASTFAGPAHDRRRAPLAPRSTSPARRRRPARLRRPSSTTRRPTPGQGCLMFTGIVEELGRVRAVTPNDGGARIEIEAATVLDDAELGASIAVNGCCLTVVELGAGWWAADAVSRDARSARTSATLARRRRGEPRAAGAPRRPARRPPRAGPRRRDRHASTAASRSPTARRWSRFDAPADVLRYVVHKGSITVDGVSLTVARCRRRRVRRRADPAHARGHDARRAPGRRPCQPRGRPASPSTSSDCSSLGQEPPADGPRRAEEASDDVHEDRERDRRGRAR